MTKIAEQVIEDGSKITIVETHDFSPVLKSADALRKSGQTGFGESRLVGRIPMALISQWCRDAGVRWDDIEARDELLKRKLLDGDFAAFRVWEGTF